MPITQIFPGLLAQMSGGGGPPPPPVVNLATLSAEGGSLTWDARTYYVQFAGSEDWALGTGDFTIEWWQWLLPGSQFPRPFSVGSYPSASVAVSIENGTFYYWANGGVITGVSLTNYENQWVHFALGRQSGVTRIFQNGVLIQTVSESNNITNNSTALTIGNETTVTETAGFLGYITNFRWTKGINVYVNNFVPTNVPLTAGANTKLLLLAETNAGAVMDTSGNHTVAGTDIGWAAVGPYSRRTLLDAGNQTSYPDPSATWFDLTTFGNNVALANITYNAGAGGYLDFGTTGNGQFLTNPALVNQNKTPSAAITMWVNISDSTNFNFVAGLRGAAEFGFWFLMLDDINQTEARVETTAGYFDINVNYSAHYGAWRHICFSVNGTRSDLYINGVQVGSNTNITGTWGTSPDYFMLGSEFGGGNQSENLKMATFGYHTRARTASEVLAEFNAERSRFGV